MITSGGWVASAVRSLDDFPVGFSSPMRYPVGQPSLGDRERDLVLEVLASGQITEGPMTRRFERCFEKYLGVEHAVMTTSGTTALHLALVALGIKPGDEVIVPDLTYVATADAVAYCGATPVLVDVRPTTFVLDAELTANAITSRTRAILPVHLYGVPCDMTALREVASAHGLFLVEDAAEGLGGFHKGQPLGTLGDVGCFSFYGNKVLTTGEGGMVVTRSGSLAEKLRSLRAMCQHPTRKYAYTGVGFNYRVTDLQAAIGVAQLERLPEMLARRQAVIDRYHARLWTLGKTIVGGTAPWLFMICVPERDALAVKLTACGVETRPAFSPMHELFGAPDWDAFPVSNHVAAHGLCLPTYADLPLDAVDKICDLVLRWM